MTDYNYSINTPTNGSLWGNGYSITNSYINSNTNNVVYTNNKSESVVEIQQSDSSLKVNGKIILNEENLDDRLKRIEDMLHIPQRNVIMEQKYEKLKNLWQEYNETLDAIKTWDTIKESK